MAIEWSDSGSDYSHRSWSGNFFGQSSTPSTPQTQLRGSSFLSRAASLPPPASQSAAEQVRGQTFLHMPVAMELLLPRSLHGVSVRGTIARKASSVADSIEESTRDSTIRHVGESLAEGAARVVSAPGEVAAEAQNRISDSNSRYKYYSQSFHPFQFSNVIPRFTNAHSFIFMTTV